MSNINILLSTLLTERVDWEVVEKLYLYALQSTVEDPNNTLTMDLSGSLQVDVAKRDIVRYMSGIDVNDDPKFPDLHISVTNNNYAEPILFVDPVAKLLCVNNAGGKTGGVTGIAGFAGEITYQQAAGISGTFDLPNNSIYFDMESFEEFLYFTNVTIPGANWSRATKLKHIRFPESTTLIREASFMGCDLREIIIPKNVTTINYAAFGGCTKVQYIVAYPTTPPSIASWIISDSGTTATALIYVPDESVDLYKTTGNWARLASRIRPISEWVQ